MEARAGKPPTKKVKVREITWYYPAPTPPNGVILRPGDRHEEVYAGSEPIGELIVNWSGKKMFVPKGWIWREEREFEMEVALEQTAVTMGG